MPERAAELAGEGVRWRGLQRWGLLDTQAGVEQPKARDAQFNTFAAGKSRLLPRRQTEAALLRLPQHPGYRPAGRQGLTRQPPYPLGVRRLFCLK